MDPNTVCRINYPDEFKELLGQLDYYKNNSVYTLESLEATKNALYFNMANYTIWGFRREILKELVNNIEYPPKTNETNENNKENDNNSVHPLLQEEMAWLQEVIQDNEKNYQVWFHRQSIIDWIGSAENEIMFINEMIRNDSKNYHAWQYRQWVVRRFNFWDGELEFCEHFLNMDIRNNSVWNNRFYVLRNTTSMNVEIRKKEIDYAFARILKSPSNEAAWCYANGLAKFNSSTLSLLNQSDKNNSTHKESNIEENYNSSKSLSQEKITKESLEILHYLEEQTRSILKRLPFNVFACTTLLYILERKSTFTQKDMEEYFELCHHLITSDSIRKNYWKFRLESATEWFEKNKNSI